MIVINNTPKNKERFIRLIEFLKELLEICEDLGIQPVLNAGLAAFVYTRDSEMNVNDIDLLIPEKYFLSIATELENREIEFQIKEYHVIRVLKDDLKIDFDSIYWPKECGIRFPETFDQVQIQGLTVNIVDLPNLIHSYKVGAEKSNTRSEDYKAKYEALTKVLENQ